MHAAFSIDDSGVLTSQMVLDRESINNYTLIIMASDGAPEPDTRTATANVTILINDENDNSPRFTSGAVLSASPVEVYEVTLTYRIAGKFGGELNLAVWRSIITTAKLKSAKISYSHIYVWRSRTEPPNLNPPIFFQ